MRLFANPHISWVNTGSRVEAHLPGAEAVISGDSALRDVVELFAGGVEVDAEVLCLLEPDLVTRLFVSFVLLTEEELSLAVDRMTVKAQHAIGRAISPTDLAMLNPDELVVLHAPIETTRGHQTPVIHGGHRVREHLAVIIPKNASDTAATDILIDFDLGREILAGDLRISDLGDVEFRPESETPLIVGRRTTSLVRRIVGASARPVVLGGDHATSYYVVDGLRWKHARFGVIHFDAHHDFYIASKPSKRKTLNHANVLSWIRDVEEVVHIFQIGLRDVYRMPASAGEYTGSTRVGFVGARQARRTAPENLLEELDRDLPYYVTFDVDVLDFAATSTTATPVGGGLSYNEAFDILECMFSSVHVIGMDIVEVGNQKMPDHLVADFAARIALLFAFSVRPTQPIRRYAAV